jgi:GntR family transcriptional regulator, transcriptional repressor for pyruvate dehydrogenase complex
MGPVLKIQALRQTRDVTDHRARPAGAPGAPLARSTVFAPLEALGRTEAVVRRLRDAITVGLLADGQQLPAEADMAGRLDVATVTVRDALAVLRGEGLVETRRGRGGGSFVRHPVGVGIAAQRERLRSLTLAEIRDVGDHYTAIAGTAARLAAERSSPGDVDDLREALEAVSPAGPGGLHRVERAFHLEVAAAAQSPRLTSSEVLLQGEIGILLWLAADADRALGRAGAAHGAILDAVRDADGARARALTEDHVGEAVERLAELRLAESDGP